MKALKRNFSGRARNRRSSEGRYCDACCEEVCERVREAIDNLEDPQQRRRFEVALQEYRRTVEELKQAVRVVAGIWADHPEFEGKGFGNGGAAFGTAKKRQ
ncbi:MAG: hypothetical protein LKKZDAJK_000575 [Candidatus Fervidibacter sp.]